MYYLDNFTLYKHELKTTIIKHISLYLKEYQSYDKKEKAIIKKLYSDYYMLNFNNILDYLPRAKSKEEFKQNLGYLIDEDFINNFYVLSPKEDEIYKKISHYAKDKIFDISELNSTFNFILAYDEESGYLLLEKKKG